jgi:hypothetical protein
MTRLGRWIGCLAVAASLPGEADAQDPSLARWTATAGIGLLDLGRVNGWAIGPAAGVRVRLGRHFAVGTDVTALVTSSGFYRFQGGQADLAIAFVPRSGTIEPELGAGVTGVLGSDSDGSIGNAAGLFGGGGVTWWIAPRLGLRGKAAWYVWHTGVTGAGASGGVTVRW